MRSSSPILRTSVVEQSRSREAVYIAWTRFQRRAEAMQSFFGYQLCYVPPPYRSSYLKPFGYVRQAWATINILLRRRPSIIWFQSPPVILGHLLVLYRLISRGQLTIIADCHNASLRPPWSSVPGTFGTLCACAVVMTHNTDAALTASRRGVPKDKIRVLRDCLFEITSQLKSAETASSKPEILVPCSFHSDEPIGEVLVAAQKLPNVNFVVTGDTTNGPGYRWALKAPANVRFTGFVPREAYDKLLADCTAVLALTRMDGIQLSAAVEGLSVSKPMVISNTNTLQALFGDCAIFVEADGSSIAEGCVTLLREIDLFKARTENTRRNWEMTWLKAAGELRRGILSS